jgi:hypothetical protein
MELLKQQAGIDLVHVPYRGGGPAAIGVMAGDVAAMFGGGSVAPLVQAGKLKGLAVSGQRRSQLLPELPAIAEVYPGYDVTIWQGLFAPVGTPPVMWRDCARRRMRFLRSRTSWRSSPPPAPAIPTSPRLRSSRRASAAITGATAS